MSNETKVTAVDWLWEQLDNTIPYQNIQTSQIFSGLFEQALAMEKEQIEQAYWDGYQNIPSMKPEQYYNETYSPK
jgi:hypothetical protein